jgi:hypothetical protein
MYQVALRIRLSQIKAENMVERCCFADKVEVEPQGCVCLELSAELIYWLDFLSLKLASGPRVSSKLSPCKKTAVAIIHAILVISVTFQPFSSTSSKQSSPVPRPDKLFRDS